MSLHLDWVGHDAIKYACFNWHYSKSLPISKTVKIGVWEDDKFIGVIVYANGACPHLHKMFGLSRFQVCELVRIALKKHKIRTKIIVYLIPILKVINLLLTHRN